MYKNYFMQIGYIYIIQNMINGKYYLGSTKNVQVRKTKHFRELRNNSHHSILLQRAVNKYGIENFEFIIIETSFDYFKREQELLDNLDFKDSYNVSSSATGGDFITNHPNRLQLIANATEVLKNAPRPKPKFGSDNPNWRGGKTFCVCGSRINSNTLVCAKCRIRTGENNPFYGKKHSEEFKKQMSELRKGKYNEKQCKPVIIDDIEYYSASEAARQLSVVTATIINRINNEKFPNYKYK